MGNEYRLTPAMASRKLQVVNFVLRYRGRWGRSPSYAEIAAAMDIFRSTAVAAVRRAIRDDLLHRLPGQGGLVAGPAWVPTPVEVEAMIAQLRAAGVVLPPSVAGEAGTLYPLPAASELEHIELDEGEA